MNIEGKVVLITGASAGIGLATAKLFAEHRATVVLAARSEKALDEAVQDIKASGSMALGVPTDIQDAAQVKHLIDAVIQEFGRVDILINNAGKSLAGNVSDLNLDDLHQLIELNVFGSLHMMQAVVPVMQKQGGGMIVNISSFMSKTIPEGVVGYTITKAALNMISQTARKELAQNNIRVLSIYPTLTETDFAENALGDQALRQHQRDEQAKTLTPDTPEYVAEKILDAVKNEIEEQYMHPEDEEKALALVNETFKKKAEDTNR